MDAIVIPSIKDCCRSPQIVSAVDLISEDFFDVQQLEILSAMENLEFIWERLQSEVIQHFRDHSEISPHFVQKSRPVQQQSNAVVDTEFLKSQTLSAVTAFCSIDIRKLFNAPGELERTKKLDSAQAMFKNKRTWF